MKKFEQLARILSRYDNQVGEDNKIYYLLNGNIVGYRQKNLIVLYFSCNPRIIWSNRDNPLVKVAIAKDFRLVKYDPICKVYRERKADVIVVEGYSGTENSFKIHNKAVLELTVDWNIYEKEVAIGETISRGHFVTFDGRIEIQVPRYMCNFELKNLQYSVLRINKKSGKAKEYSLTEYLKEKNDWYYHSGWRTRGSDETRKAIELTKKCNYKKIARAQIKFK